MRALAVGVLWAAATWATESTDGLLSSPLWIWGWIVLPVAALLLARAGEHPAGVAAGLCGPLAVAFVVHGDPPGSAGPAFWPIGALLCLALAGICAAAALTGREVRPVQQPVSRSSDDPGSSA